MNAKYFSIIILLLCGFIHGQTVVLNEKLLTQLTKNQAARLASDASFFNSYEKQRKLYDDINTKITQIVAIQEFIYRQLKNVDAAIMQSKKLAYLYEYLGKIANNSGEMLSLTAQYPEYAVLVSKYYIQIGKEVVKLEQEITEALLNENNDFLMDPNDREMLLEKIFNRARMINGNILYINLRLKNAKKTPYLYQIPTLNDYVNLDKMIIKDIVQKYGILKY
jgi:Fe-S cluster biosynthesis and repair protein YggX